MGEIDKEKGRYMGDIHNKIQIQKIQIQNTDTDPLKRGSVGEINNLKRGLL